MSIEEKAKAYDEALEKAKEHINSKGIGDTVNLCKHLFPELRESEDERIRKALIDGVSQIRCKGDVTREQMIAYLERQKYDRMKPIYDTRESFESALEKAWNDYHNGYENVDKLEDDYVECAHAKGFREGYLFGLEKQKESLRDFIDDFPYSDQKEPKFKIGDKLVSTKNSHLTYEILDVGHVNELGNIEYKVEIFTDGKSDNPSNVKYMECRKVDEWGKLIEQKSTATINGKPIPTENHSVNIPLAEWSKEDEAHRNFILESLEDQIRFCKKDAEGAYYAKQIRTAQNWLKLLDSQSKRDCKDCAMFLNGECTKPRWKPSEHQMTILKAVKAYIGRGSGYWGEGLGSLIEDLEKL